MAKDPARQQRTDATRIGASGTGKLDRQAPRERTESAPRRGRPTPEGERPEREAYDLPAIRARLVTNRDETITRLRNLGISPDTDDTAPRAGVGVGIDEGDQAQASERQDMSFATRERLADRINELTAAIERIDGGTYGRCTECDAPIERNRLAAVPEAATCLACQERREREGGAFRAA